MTEANTVTRSDRTDRRPARRLPPKPLSFEVDERIGIKIDFDLALDLAELIVNAQPDNPALMALGLRLKSLNKSE